jgi:transposase
MDFNFDRSDAMSSTTPASEIRVCLDIGCYEHHVSVGLSTGEFLEGFTIAHEKEGFNQFFREISKHEDRLNLPVSVAMEGFNGHARPLDQLINKSDYRLFNVNNLKLRRYKEIFPSPGKTDAIDSRKGLELFQLKDHLPLAGDVLQEVSPTPKVHQKLKRLTRRRGQLVSEKVRYLGRLQSDLQAISPGLLTITGAIDNLWFLRLITSVNAIEKLKTKRASSLLKIPGIGQVYLKKIVDWQAQGYFSEEAIWVGSMVIEDAEHVLSLVERIKQLQTEIGVCNSESEMAPWIESIPGFGVISSGVLAGEIGNIERFEKEASLSMYMGMSALDNSSGLYKGSKTPKQVNQRIKRAMMTAVDRHRCHVAESQKYYDKKRAEGKKHNQAIRSLGRHLARVIFKMLKENRVYEERSVIKNETSMKK